MSHRCCWMLLLACVVGQIAMPGAAIGEERAENLPSIDELERQGAVVGHIDIDIGNVFATELPEENKSLFRLANRLHITTRPDIVRQQLLFASGQPVSARLIQESERILRANRYLSEADIVPMRYRDGVVDLLVRTRDVWTFKPGINYGRSGGKNTSGFEVQESNLLGYGKEVTIARRASVDRTASELRYFDPRVFGSWTQFLGSYSSNSDGRYRYVSLDRPFYSLDTHWAVGGNAFDWQRTDQRYALGAVADEFRHFQQQADLTGGWSAGWRNGWVRRFAYGAMYESDRFAPTGTILSAAELPADRKLVYPFVGFTLLQDDFQKRRNLDQIERTEDFYIGTFVQARLGYATPAFGADRSAWIWSVSAGTSFETVQREHTLVLRGDARARQEHGGTRNFISNLDANYYWRVADRQLFYAALHVSAVSHLDAERQLMLGGDTGLRGYPLRYQEGTRQALLTLEHRTYTSYYLFRLFHLGGAVFFDAGRVWGESNPHLSAVPQASSPYLRQGLLKDIGLGLRFGSSRSAFGNVIHVDIAFPLDGDPSIKRVQFVLQTKQSF